MPLSVGIDHVITHLSHADRAGPALVTIAEPAVRHGLVLHDPQLDETFS
ncbi:hypothetical protein [Nonomuraea sp. NPDC049504]